MLRAHGRDSGGGGVAGWLEPGAGTQGSRKGSGRRWPGGTWVEGGMVGLVGSRRWLQGVDHFLLCQFWVVLLKGPYDFLSF